MKKIVVINGHSKEGSFNEAIANTYTDHKRTIGHKVETLHLYKMTFDPVLKTEYKEGDAKQPLEEDLKRASELIQNADHLVFIYPVWWGNMPAILKGFIDRVFVPGFAFRYHKDSPFWDKLLSGKSATVITTSDSPNFWLKLVNWSAPSRVLTKSVLDFCGIKTKKVLNFAEVRKSTQASREKFLKKVQTLDSHL